jgi:DNA-binding NarL/FixJ family response regulator
MTARPTVLIADDHPLVCDGLKFMLEPYYTVVAMVHDGNDVLASAARYRPDLVLMDLALPGQNGLALTRQLKGLGESPRVVVVTMHGERVYVDEALRAGADGYLLKTARASELRAALQEILAGRQYISPDLRPSRPSPPGGPATIYPPLDGELAGVGGLSERQRIVLLLIGQGFSTPEIASRLGISVKAIEYHRSAIRQALAITSQAGLYRIAARYAERVEQGEKT